VEEIRAMQKWEYIELRIFGPEWADSRGNSGKVAPSAARHGYTGQWRSIAPILNELGAEGWEMAGIADDASPNAYTAFFKRLVP
jgi:hypothetical protein